MPATSVEEWLRSGRVDGPPHRCKRIVREWTTVAMSSLSRRACYKCGNVGHYAEVCSSAERLCYNCKLTALPFDSAVLELVEDATTATSQDIWRALAQILLALDQLLVLAVVPVPDVADTEVSLAVDMLVDPAQLLATSAVVQTTLLGIARLRP
ncbi:hypothetical protein F5884DRAFT_354030 [Xylogone sp. PMI_703]|nr:hypothetical protein F5884DRAFT_354030 [Xylogone sp. PMI_703]